MIMARMRTVRTVDKDYSSEVAAARNAASNKSRLSDEQLVSALIASGTIKAAAESLGISERTIYERMRDKDFKECYLAARSEIVRQAVQRFNDKLISAVDTIAAIMENEENNAAVRLQAAQTILNNAGKFIDRMHEEDQRIENAKPSLIGDWF